MAEEVKVWDLLVRLGHWTLALCVFGALLTRQGGTAHEVFGYAALGIVALRLVWGFVGPPTARFASFVRGLRPTLSYGRAVMARSDARHIGHNPLGAWMIVALLGLAFVAAATGALFVTDAFWGGRVGRRNPCGFGLRAAGDRPHSCRRGHLCLGTTSRKPHRDDAAWPEASSLRGYPRQLLRTRIPAERHRPDRRNLSVP